ncbi:MAG: TolC family protein [Bacteroidaceae bacterium]|nr:TolC family protein [Bacteroidaceae bacterium]
MAATNGWKWRMLFCISIIINCQLSIVNYAQAQRVVLDIERTVQLATDSSYSAQKHRSQYDISRFQYLSWQASRKPQFSLESTPVMYERYMTQRYISDTDRDEYRVQRYLYSDAGISATQKFEPLGGSFYGASQLGYLRTFGDGSQRQFMTVPLSFGYRQELLFYNGLKWDCEIEPLKLTRAEKELAYGIETAASEAVELFFGLALAQSSVRMSEEYLAACDTIYAIGERRFKIASISKAELSMLELEKTNAGITLTNARIAHTRAVQELATYLGMDPAMEIELVIPSVIPNLIIDATEAVEQARENNPHYIEMQQAVAEARRDAARAQVEKNFSVGLDVRVGFNQASSRFVDAYRNLLSQDMATVTLNVPLVDWGRRKNIYQAALSKLEMAEQTERESASNTEVAVRLAAGEFNERQSIVASASEALSIAEEAYTQTLGRFIRAQADVYELLLAQSHWQTANQNQIASLQNYWLSYYQLRRLTLFDYRLRQPIRYVSQ